MLSDPADLLSGFEAVDEADWPLTQSDLADPGFLGLMKGPDGSGIELQAQNGDFVVASSVLQDPVNGFRGPAKTDGSVSLSKNVELFVFVDDLV